MSNERERWVKELRKAISDESHRRKSFADMERYSAILRDPETRSNVLTSIKLVSCVQLFLASFSPYLLAYQDSLYHVQTCLSSSNQYILVYKIFCTAHILSYLTTVPFCLCNICPQGQ